MFIRYQIWNFSIFFEKYSDTEFRDRPVVAELFYVGLPKISENLNLPRKPLALRTCTASCLFLYISTNSLASGVFISARVSEFWLFFDTVYMGVCDYRNGGGTSTFQPDFHFREHAEIAGGQIRWVGRVDRKLGSCLTAFCISVHTWTRWSRWLSFKRRETNFAAIHLMFSSSARMRWHDPYNSLTRLQTSWIVCLLSSRITSRTFAIISGVVHVESRPECLSSSTDSRPSLKCLNHTNVLA
jgi:hypothetical protein